MVREVKLRPAWNLKVEYKKSALVNETIELSYENAGQIKTEKENGKKRFVDITHETGLDFVHIEDNYDDFLVEPLLPHKKSIADLKE